VIEINIKDDLKGYERTLGVISKHVLPAATIQALNKTGKTLESLTIKTLAKESGTQQKIIREQIKPFTFRAGRNAVKFVIDVSRAKARNLINFVSPSRRTPQFFRKRSKAGFKYKGVIAKAWGQTKEYQGAFIGNSSSGNMMVYKRGQNNKPVPVVGPSPRKIFEKPEVNQLLITKAGERLPIEMERAIKFQLTKI